MIAWKHPPRRQEKAALAKLSPEQIKLSELAGEKIQAILTCAPGNDAPIGGLKAVTKSGWFAARPSGTEDIYKIYAESFRGDSHLRRILEEAQTIVSATLAGHGGWPEGRRPRISRRKVMPSRHGAMKAILTELFHG